MTFNDITSIENLLVAWEEFLRGKRKRKDVQEFQMNLMDNVLDLHRDLRDNTYRHGPYEAFNISDPKPRNIHKATVRDRLLHHAIYRQLYPVCDKTFIAHSYSCRVNKGTHKALNTFTSFARKVSNNHTTTAWVLKCDIKKFFASIDHEILFSILEKKIPDQELLKLLREIVGSFETMPSKGLPLGNLTSQLLVNIYMNEFDQWVKREVKAKYYIRYADDFVFISRDRQNLADIVRLTVLYLRASLKLELHPNKVSITTIASGVDFLGWVHFPKHRTLRSVTKRRVFRNMRSHTFESTTVQSYLGLLKHGNTYKLQEKISTVSTSAIM
jgi:RNA-directed DNA polymerase